MEAALQKKSLSRRDRVKHNTIEANRLLNLAEEIEREKEDFESESEEKRWIRERAQKKITRFLL